jgi:hypothetical protein
VSASAGRADSPAAPRAASAAGPDRPRASWPGAAPLAARPLARRCPGAGRIAARSCPDVRPAARVAPEPVPPLSADPGPLPAGLVVLGAGVPVQADPGVVDSVRAVPAQSVPAQSGPVGPGPGWPGPGRPVPDWSFPPGAGPVPGGPGAVPGVPGPAGPAPGVPGPVPVAPAAAGLIRGVHGPPGLGRVVSAPPVPGSGVPGSGVPGVCGPGPAALGGHGPAGPDPAVPAPSAPAADGSVPGLARPAPVRARRTRRGNSTCAAGSTGLPSSRAPAPPVIAVLTGELADTWSDAGTWSRRCRPAGGTMTEPPTAGGPGLVLPRDRDLPGPSRMYRRTRSKSRSRISRTPSDRVPGCQRMTKLRERHLPLPAVTVYGSRTVTE